MRLAIDTSTETTGLALIEGEDVPAEMTWLCEQNHSVELLPHLTRLLERAGVGLDDIKGIIVALGPGGFNALRVGVSTAKGLAFSLALPIAGVSTLEAEGYRHRQAGLPICPVANAGRGEIAAALYEMEEGRWRRITAEHITTVEALCHNTAEKTLFCGEFAPSIAAELAERLGGRAVLAEAQTPRVVSLAMLGSLRLDEGGGDATTLQPIYLRRPPITERKHR